MCELFNIVKDNLSMTQVARHFGYEPNQAGFIKSPFKDERTASCKLYEHSFYDFATNRGGDMIKFAASILGANNWQAAQYLVQAFSLPISLSGCIDCREEIERRRQEKQRQKEVERMFKEAWRDEVGRLKWLEELYLFVLDKKIFTPLSDFHFRAVRRLQAVRYRLDILCTGSRQEQEALLKEADRIGPGK